MSQTQQEQILKLRPKNLTIREIASLVRTSKDTVRRLLRGVSPPSKKEEVEVEEEEEDVITLKEADDTIKEIEGTR